jgi:hypothetical protein
MVATLPAVLHYLGQRYVRATAASASDPYGGCPVCGGKVIRSCRCFLADRECERGHQWHYARTGPHDPQRRLVLGPAH